MPDDVAIPEPGYEAVHERFECKECGGVFDGYANYPGSRGAACVECRGRLCPSCVTDQVARAVCHVRASSLRRAGGLICAACVDRIRGEGYK